MTEAFWRHICEGRARNARDVMKSNLPHHDVWRSLNSHDYENRILTAAQSPLPTVLLLQNRHAVHFTRPVCSSFLLQAYRMPLWNGLYLWIYDYISSDVRDSRVPLLRFQNPVPPTFANYSRNTSIEDTYPA